MLGDNLGIDEVEQVSVLGSNYPAEYGRTSGGVINAIARPGTKAFNGDIYEFFRNSALDAASGWSTEHRFWRWKNSLPGCAACSPGFSRRAMPQATCWRPFIIFFFLSDGAGAPCFF